MIHIQNKTRPSLDHYINKMMKTVHENPNEGKKLSPAEMLPIKMNNYEISFGKQVRKGGRRNRNAFANQTMGSEEFKQKLGKLNTTAATGFGEMNKDLAFLSSDKLTKLNA